MPEESLLRLTELVRRELGAKNARVEIGGDPPDDPSALFRELSGGWRVVAVFASPPPDREPLLARLDTLVQSFSGLAAGATAGGLLLRVPVARALAAALADLAARAGGTDAMVIDTSSPVVWGTSDASRPESEDVDVLLQAAVLDERARAAGVDIAPLFSVDAGELGRTLARTQVSDALRAEITREVRALKTHMSPRDDAGNRRFLTAARAAAAARKLAATSAAPSHPHLSGSSREDDFGCFVRAFANIYLLLIAFDGTFSELHAEAAMLHALPRIERLVLSLPPTPSPVGGPTREARVVSLAGRRMAKRSR